MGTLLGIVALLASLGFPTIFGLTVNCIKSCKKFYRQIEILQAAQKAQMRSQLLNQYYTYASRGYITADELDDWINQHKAYHELVGENGVLEARRDELLKLPSYPKAM